MEINAAERLKASYTLNLNVEPLQTLADLLANLGLHPSSSITEFRLGTDAFPGCKLKVEVEKLKDLFLAKLKKPFEEQVGSYTCVSVDAVQEYPDEHGRVLDKQTLVIRSVDDFSLLLMVPRWKFLKIKHQL